MAAVLIHSFDYPPNDGGISRLCGGIASTCAHAGMDIRVLTQTAAQCGLAGTEIKERRVSAVRPLREYNAWVELRRAHSLVICGLWYPEGVLTVLAGRRPLVILAHGGELLPACSRWRRKAWAVLCRRTLESADLVVANSRYTAELVRGTAPKAITKVVLPAVDHIRFGLGDRSRAKRRFGVEDKHVLCTVSRLQPHKGHELVLEAMSWLDDSERERLCYLVAGKGPQEQDLRDRAKKLRVDSTVRWLGFVSEGDLPDLYRAADVFVLCSRELRDRQAVEGFGLVLLEAQSCGTAVLATRTGGICDAVSDGNGGWLIAENDVTALAGFLSDLVHDPHKFAVAGRLARQRVEGEYTWRRYIARFTAALAARGIAFG